MPDSEGQYTEFPASDYASRCFERIAEFGHEAREPMEMAAICYAEVILSHPLQDSNGRVARALALGQLLRETGSIPLLPLGPICYVEAQLLITALRALSATGDWGPFFATFQHLLLEALLEARAALGWLNPDDRTTSAYLDALGHWHAALPPDVG